MFPVLKGHEMTDKLYASRDHIAQGDAYLRHVSAMTAEGLHAKSAIAGELAHRDIEIERLLADLKDYMDAATAEAKAGDEARDECRRLRASLALLVPNQCHK